MSTQFNCQNISLSNYSSSFIYNNSVLCKYSFIAKTVQFQSIQFSISTLFKTKYTV